MLGVSLIDIKISVKALASSRSPPLHLAFLWLFFGLVFPKSSFTPILGWRKFSCIASQHGSKDLEAPHRYLHQILWFAAPAHILHLQARDASVYKVSGIFTYVLYLIIFGRA